MIKTLSLAAGVAGAVAFSQIPAFSQQYLQRLAGQVDALTTVVMDFDQSALSTGLGREAALQQMTGTPFLDARQSDMRTTFARHTRLSDHLLTLRTATPVQRLAMPHRHSDIATIKATWADFTPGLSMTPDGALAAGTGAVAGWGVASAFLSIFAWPFRRRRNKPVAAPTPRTDPILQAHSPQATTLRADIRHPAE